MGLRPDDELRKRHICFVAPNAYPLVSGDFTQKILGGAELQQVTIARNLVARGYRVSMICFDSGQPDSLQIDGISIYKTYRLTAGIPLLRFLHPRLTSIWSALKRANADVYYTRTASMLVGVVAAFGRRHKKCTLFAAADNSDFSPSQTKIRYRRDNWIFKFGLRNSSRILVQNAEQKRLCKVNYGRNAKIVRNCYEPPKEIGPQQRSTVLWVSTIRKLKCPELFIELAKLLPQKNFVMIGGPDRFQKDLYDSISRCAKDLKNMDFRGFVPYSRIDTYFNNARVFVNTSETEGFPNTFLQAWARSIPTVSFFDCQARHGQERVGYCVESLAEMAGVVERLFADELEYDRAGQVCLEYFKNRHSVESTVDDFEAVLRETFVLPCE